MFDDIVFKQELAKVFCERGILSGSTLNKLASGNYPQNGSFDDFPRPFHVGRTAAWRKADIEAWIEARACRPARSQSQGSIDSEPSSAAHRSGRGRPSRKERQAAAAAGMTVPAWRAEQVRRATEAEGGEV